MSFFNEMNINNVFKVGMRVGGWEVWKKESV